MADTPSTRDELEVQLRQLLAPVELVCDADISQSLIEAAEAEARPLVKLEQFQRLAHRYPAIWVTFLVLVGSEHYQGNAFWGGVGVEGNSSDAGRAFLDALERLGLPNFGEYVEAAGARRFVAPILIHGALPSEVAPRLLERVETELRRGLLNGAEARRRLIADRDIQTTLRRPATRLLQWCPEYADRLLDSLIDHIENPNGVGLARLPVHLQHALTTTTDRRKGLRRVSQPTVEFQLWSGFGPEVVAAKSTTWAVEWAGRLPLRLGDDQRVEVPPSTEVAATMAGRRLVLLAEQQVLFFDHSGRPIAGDVPLPASFVAVLPRDWTLRSPDGRPIEEDDEGVPLSGQWSRYRSCAVTLVSREHVCVGPSDAPHDHVVRRSVEDSGDPWLEGDAVAGVVSSIGGAVRTRLPLVRVPGSTVDELGAWFTPLGGTGRYVALRAVPEPPESFALSPDELTGPVVGTLLLRGAGARRGSSLALTVVPDLEIVVPTTPVAPDGPIEITATAAPGVLVNDGVIAAFGPADALVLAVVGLPAGTVSVPLPRVQWWLRSAGLARLDEPTGPIWSSHESLLGESVWLTVRTGLPSTVGLRLTVAGSEAQTIQGKQTKSSGPASHHRSVSLDEFRDTIRAHPDEQIEIFVVVDGHDFLAVTCGGRVHPTSVTRTWGARVVVVEPEDPFKNVDWIGKELRDGKPRTELEEHLRRLDGGDAVVAFLQVLGRKHRRWKVADFAHGPSGVEWDYLMASANPLWRIDGVRLRVFTGGLDSRLATWARSRREELRRASELRRQFIETWLFGRVPDLDRLRDWRHLDWVTSALPPNASLSCQWMPAVVLYHCLALVAGDEDSGPVVASAAEAAPEIVLEVVAFLMQATREGLRVQSPVVAEVELDGTQAVRGAGSDDPQDGPRGPALMLAECAIDIAGGQICVEMPGDMEVPLFRLSRSGKPLALLVPHVDGRTLTLTQPIEVSGSLNLEAVRGTELGEVTGGREIELQSLPLPEVARVSRVHDPGRLGDARADAMLDYVAEIVDAGGTAQRQISELFDEDPYVTASAVARLPDRMVSSRTVDLVGIAVLPCAMLSEHLGLLAGQLLPIRSRLLYAALAPRSPSAWANLGWRNSSRFVAGTRPLDEWIGFAAKKGKAHSQRDLRTARYMRASGYDAAGEVNRAIDKLAAALPGRAFVDLLVATHRMLTVDVVALEAMRTLLDAYRRQPELTADAVVAGTALFLAARRIQETL